MSGYEITGLQTTTVSIKMAPKEFEEFLIKALKQEYNIEGYSTVEVDQPNLTQQMWRGVNNPLPTRITLRKTKEVSV